MALCRKSLRIALRSFSPSPSTPEMHLSLPRRKHSLPPSSMRKLRFDSPVDAPARLGGRKRAPPKPPLPKIESYPQDSNVSVTPGRSSSTTEETCAEIADVPKRLRRNGKRKKEEIRDGIIPQEPNSSVMALVSVASLPIDTPILYQGPYPNFLRPSPDECREVKDRLRQLHGALEEYATTEPQRLALTYHKDEDCSGDTPSTSGHTKTMSQTQISSLATSTYPREGRDVLDALVGTILSQNTTDWNSRRAFLSLKDRFPTWEEVLAADPKAVEDAVRCGGLPQIKASRIINILDTIYRERGIISLEYVRSMSTDEIKLELSRFKGVGPKTVYAMGDRIVNIIAS